MKNKRQEVKLRHHILTSFLKPFVGIFLKIFYKIKIKNYRALKHKGPYVVLANHTVNVDPMVMGLHFPFPLYYIATEQVFNLGFLSKALRFIINPIRKSKSVSDMETIRKSKRIVNQGGSIGIFPEGNTTYSGENVYMTPATVKLIKMLKIPVIIINMKGLYLTFPRWAVYRKKGKATSYIKKIILPETYLEWTDEAFYQIISEHLYVNAYDDQASSGQLYKGKKIAHGLEKLIFMDLKTFEPFVTYSQKNTLKSRTSDFKLIYLPNGRILTQDGTESTLIEMEKMVKIAYFNYYKTTQTNNLFKETILLQQSYVTKKDKLGTFTLNLNKDSIVLSRQSINYTWYFDDIVNIVMQGKYQIIVYLEKDTFILRLDTYSSIYKYVLTYQYYKYIQSGGSSIDDKYNDFGI